MAGEKNLWALMKKKLPKTRSCHFVRHEDMLHRGVPDVSYAWDGVQGWIELKCYEAWKKQDYHHFATWTPEQRFWMSRRYSADWHCFLLVHIGDEYILFNGALANEKVDTMSKAQLMDFALQKCVGKLDMDVMRRSLCSA